jgi:hypothetical protein
VAERVGSSHTHSSPPLALHRISSRANLWRLQCQLNRHVDLVKVARSAIRLRAHPRHPSTCRHAALFDSPYSRRAGARDAEVRGALAHWGGTVGMRWCWIGSAMEAGGTRSLRRAQLMRVEEPARQGGGGGGGARRSFPLGGGRASGQTCEYGGVG